MNINDLFANKISEVESTTLTSNIQTSAEIDAEKKLKAFVQELLTTKSPVLKPGYGTTFINDLGEIVNIYKMRYYLQSNADSIKNKYNISTVEIADVKKNGNALIGHIEAVFNENIKKTVNFQIDWKDRMFTTEAIVE